MFNWWYKYRIYNRECESTSYIKDAYSRLFCFIHDPAECDAIEYRSAHSQRILVETHHSERVNGRRDYAGKMVLFHRTGVALRLDDACYWAGQWIPAPL